jgi:putative heme-binding domain-containing protein
MLAHGDAATALAPLVAVLDSASDADLQVAAVRALAQLPGGGAAPLLERHRWQGFTPRVREAVLSSLLAEDRHVPALLDAVASATIPPSAFSPMRRSRLLAHRDSAIQSRARTAFSGLAAGDRMQVYERLRARLGATAGSAAAGGRIFAARCEACHTASGSAAAIGPALTGLRHQPADAILLHIIVPDYEIAAGYEAYSVTTRDGTTLVGRVEGETASTVTLTDASSQRHVLLRDRIRTMEAAGSLMPNELERGLGDQDVADLIAYLKRAGERAPGDAGRTR